MSKFPAFNLRTIDTMDHPKLYIAKGYKSRLNTPEELIKFFIMNKPASYNDPDISLDTICCSSERRRSLSDIFFTTKTYFPDITFREVFNISKTVPSYGMRCLDIKKYVHCSRFSVHREDDKTEFYDLPEGEPVYLKNLIRYNKLVKMMK